MDSLAKNEVMPQKEQESTTDVCRGYAPKFFDEDEDDYESYQREDRNN